MALLKSVNMVWNFEVVDGVTLTISELTKATHEVFNRYDWIKYDDAGVFRHGNGFTLVVWGCENSEAVEVLIEDIVERAHENAKEAAGS